MQRSRGRASSTAFLAKSQEREILLFGYLAMPMTETGSNQLWIYDTTLRVWRSAGRTGGSRLRTKLRNRSPA
ncbi:MAG: hypothetical protein HC833_24470 [Leptolyngbyaceae cyanobacterium RM1_406_9]|nr:hypothetical protein [Leptolyngbyaceae cyanobacterium RM1_406_9]